MFGFSTGKLIALAVAAAAILSFVLLAFSWKNRMEDRGVQLTTICASVRAAADNPKMDCKAVPQQIGLMGKAIVDLKAGVANQNAAISALAVENNREKAAAVVAVKKAQGRAQAAQAASDRYTASSRLAVPPGACAPSKAVKDTWQ